MRYPSFLNKGDTVGFVAPSFGCAIEPYYTAFMHADRKWHELGFDTKCGPNCFANDGIGISSTPDKCAKEFMSMYKDKSVQALISCGGGELMCEILDYIDFCELASLTPKWFMGYSDNTNLTFLLTTLTDTASIYGPNAASFGMEPWHDSIQDAYELLRGERLRVSNYPFWERESLKDEEHPLAPYNVTEHFSMVTYPQTDDITIKGRLLGGCLDCLSHLAGTRFDQVPEFINKYAKDGIIWYLEACDLNVMEIRRSLWSLKESGWFMHVGGFLIGRPMHYNEPILGLDQYEAVIGVLSEFNKPIIMDLDIGHTAPMMPLINGSYATVHAASSGIHIDMELK